MTQATTVSLLIPAYKPDYFEECLQSCLAQQGPVTEIIISDDCPDDSIHTIIKPYLDSAHPRITYKRNTPSLGLAANYLQLAEMARSEWCKYVDDDDRLAPHCISTLLNKVAADTALIIGGCELIQEGNRREVKKMDIPAYTAGEDYFLHTYPRAPITLFTRFMVRTSVMKALLEAPLPAGMISLDELVGLHACLHGGIAYQPEVVCMHRNFESGYSRNTDLHVLQDDRAYFMAPYTAAQNDPRFRPTELKKWKKRMLRKYTRGILSKLIKQKRHHDLKQFCAMLRKEFGLLAYDAMFSPRLIVKLIKSIF